MEEMYKNYSPPGSESNESIIGIMFKAGIALCICGIVAVALDGCGSGSAPTPAPTIDSVGLAMAQALSESSRTLNEIAKESADADRNEAHPTPTPIPPSETERIAKAVAFPVAASVMCLGVVVLGFAALLLWNNEHRRKADLERQRIAAQVAQTQIADLRAVVESLREYQQAADVSPRNNEETNGTETE